MSAMKTYGPEGDTCHVPQVRSKSLCTDIDHHVESYGDDVVQIWNDYRVIRCGGCKNIQLQIAHTNSEDVDYDEGPDGQPYVTPNETYTYWPPLAQRPKPEWFNSIELHDRILGAILTETYHAPDNEKSIAAAITMRTAFDGVTELLKIDVTLPFSKKLQALQDKGESALRHVPEAQHASGSEAIGALDR